MKYKIKTIQEKLLLILLHNCEIQGECIVFTGGTVHGHGILYWKRTAYYLHRIMYCILNKIPYTTIYDIHHICENKKMFYIRSFNTYESFCTW